ncbi:MAG TPA: hypothetical protein VGB55_13785, partial [Tepidisphaeraceae bacterium]
IFPNRDPALRKTSAEFAADAAKRHPYQANAPRGGQAKAGAEVGYVFDRLDVINLSDVEWTDVELWINQNYVIFLPRMEAKTIKTVPFQALYDASGNSFPLGNGKLLNRQPVVVDRVELYRDGKLYDVPVRNVE